MDAKCNVTKLRCWSRQTLKKRINTEMQMFLYLCKHPHTSLPHLLSENAKPDEQAQLKHILFWNFIWCVFISDLWGTCHSKCVFNLHV